MTDSTTQTYANHRQFVPAFHYGLLPILVVNVIWNGSRFVGRPSIDTAIAALLAFAFIMFAVLARVFAIRVQDRVIRLEMRLRLKALLPTDLSPRILEFSTAQLVALRFANDEELPSLAATVLRDQINNRDVIKKMIRNWVPDTLRV